MTAEIIIEAINITIKNINVLIIVLIAIIFA